MHARHSRITFLSLIHRLGTSIARGNARAK